GAGSAERAPRGAVERDRRSARGLSHRLPHARRGGALEPGDRRVAGDQPARGEVARAPLAAVPASAPLALSQRRLTPRPSRPRKSAPILTCRGGVWAHEPSRRNPTRVVGI